jgi:hypothetical protein
LDESCGGLIELNLALVSDFPVERFSRIQRLLVIFVIQEQGRLYLNFAVKWVVAFEDLPLGRLVRIGVSSSMGRTYSVEVSPSRIVCFVELVHHILIKLFYTIHYNLQSQALPINSFTTSGC